MTRRPDDVQICSFSLDSSESAAERWVQVLDDAEMARANAFQFSGDRDRFITVRGILRALLARRLELRPADLRFHLGPWGKPTLATGALEFSVSHSKSWALIAIHPSARLGIDLEATRSLPDLMGLAKQAFTNREVAELSSLTREEQEDAFFRIWTRKESIAKALGEGLRAMPRFSVNAGSEPRLLEMDPELGNALDWRMLDLHDIPLHAACLAVEADDWQISFSSVP